MKLKIAVIGGGSSYTPELIDGFIKKYDTLPVGELWLVDIPAGKSKLEIIAAFAKRMVKKADVPIEIYATLDRREALEDADYVLTQLRVGQLQARIKDERIPLAHGLLGQETNGAGGLFKAMRTLPVILDICKDMEKLCPKAWLINFTNPVGIVLEGINRYSDFKKFIGLCNLPYGMHKTIAEQLNRPMSEVAVTMGGLNHMLYATKVELDGKDVTQEVLKNYGTGSNVKNINAMEWDGDFLKELGALPCSYHRYYYMSGEYLAEALEKYEKNETRAELVDKVEKELFEVYSDPKLDTKPEALEKRGGAFYSEAACNLINSIHNDLGDIQVVDTINKGAIKNFKYDEIVETGCKITKDGPVPIEGIELPQTVNGLLQTIKSFEIAGAKAAVTGSRATAVMAMMINPLVASQAKAKELFDEMFKAHREELPRFGGGSEM